MIEILGYYISGVIFMLILGSVYYHKVLYKDDIYDFELKDERFVLIVFTILSWAGFILFIISYIIDDKFKKGKDI